MKSAIKWKCQCGENHTIIETTANTYALSSLTLVCEVCKEIQVKRLSDGIVSELTEVETLQLLAHNFPYLTDIQFRMSCKNYHRYMCLYDGWTHDIKVDRHLGEDLTLSVYERIHDNGDPFEYLEALNESAFVNVEMLHEVACTTINSH
ncbi:hypothetical protein MKY96_32440 [Paenibacillus sp. FSL R7-0302]|uniref:hypothetical protein n=1 Tax=Paenibacillus sp. FSL R7-0302 TaxID=2921681 RepID=UPI0030F9DE21